MTALRKKRCNTHDGGKIQFERFERAALLQ